MHFSNEDEVIAAIKQLLQDKSETLELYGNIVDRIIRDHFYHGKALPDGYIYDTED